MANPEVCFHVAPVAVRGGIRQRGLLPGHPSGARAGGVHLWDTFARALRFASDYHRLMGEVDAGRCDVWRVDVRGMVLRRHPDLGEQGSWVTHRRLLAQRCGLMVPGADDTDLALATHVAAWAGGPGR